MMVISTLGVVFRFAARFMSAAPYGADDNLIIAALIFTYGLNINEIIAVHYGLGEHQLMLSLDHIMRFLQADWTTQIIFGCAISLTRLSLLFFYRRIFATKTFHWLSVIMGVFLVAWWISYVTAVILSCRPVNAFWDQSIKGHCMNEMTLAYGLTATELVMNIALVIMPIPWIIRLNLPKEKKFAIGGVFMLGGFVLVACSLRFPFLAEFKYTDASWTIAGSGIWVNIEANVGIASVCLPVMRPLFNALRISNLRTSFSNSREKRRSLTTDTALESGMSGGSRYSHMDEKKPKRNSDNSVKKHQHKQSLVRQLEKAGLRDPPPEWQRPTSWLDPRSRGATHRKTSSAPVKPAHIRPQKHQQVASEAPPTRPPTPPPKDEIYLALQRSSTHPLSQPPRQSNQLPRKPVPTPLNLKMSSYSPSQIYHPLPAVAYSPGPYRQLHSAAGNYSQSTHRRTSSPIALAHPSPLGSSPYSSPTTLGNPTISRLSSRYATGNPRGSSSVTTTTSPERRLSKIQDRLSRESLRQERAEARLAEARRVVGEQRKRSHSALEAARRESNGSGSSTWVTSTPIIQRPASLEQRAWRESRGYGVVGAMDTVPTHGGAVQSRVRSESSQGDYSTGTGLGKRMRGRSISRDYEAKAHGKRKAEEEAVVMVRGDDGGDEMDVPEGRIGVRRSIELRRWSSH